MDKQLLYNREAIELLVNTFYTKVKKDDLLAPIFNNAEYFSWDTHIPIMVNFWETLLLDTASYKGNTMEKHIQLNRRTPLTDEHFERWKDLFYTTLDELFHGPGVIEARKKVESISGLMQFKIKRADNKNLL
jgi:hemoglobin